MGDGRVNRAIREGKARSGEIKARVPELKERVPEITSRVPEMTARGADELRTRGTELRSRGSEAVRQRYARMDVRWARCAPARALREGLITLGLGPMIDLYCRPRASGRELFETLTPPVIFVANHSSHLDTPTILRALPLKWRQRTAVAAAADYFYKRRSNAWGVALLFNTVPLARKGGGMGSGATDHVDRLIDQSWNLVMFPEGTRSRDGSIGKLHSGAAVLAAHHGIPIVPIFLEGTHQAMPPGQNWPKRKRGRFFSQRHDVTTRFGEPIWPTEDQRPSEVMERVRAFFDRRGMAEEPSSSEPAPSVAAAADVLVSADAPPVIVLPDAPAPRFAPAPLHVEPQPVGSRSPAAAGDPGAPV
jgi:1-acyl-sn-glycerol-3-phosphate acyltransferase